VKTISLKKVSAVAVASLGFGLLSVVPANAATARATTAVEFLSAAQSVAVGGTASSVLKVTAAAALAGGQTDTAKYLVDLLSKPLDSSVTLDTRDGSGTTDIFAAPSSLDTAVSASALVAATGIGTVTGSTSGSVDSATVLTAGTLSIIPDKAGIYVLRARATDSAGANPIANTAKTFTIYAGYAIAPSTYANTAFPTVGVNTTTGWSATAGGRGTVRLTNFVTASNPTYFVTATGGSIVNAVEIGSGTGVGTVAKTNGTSYTDGITFDTSSATVSDAVDVTVQAGTTPVTVTVAYYSAAGVLTTHSVSTMAVGVAPALSTANSTAVLGAGTGNSAVTGVDDVISADAATGVQRGNVKITLKDQYENALMSQTLSAVVSGPALIKFSQATQGTAGTATADSLTLSSSENTAFLGINGTGVGGTVTITISAGTTVIATKTLTMYGTAKTLTATAAKKFLSVGANADAIAILAKDATGNVATYTPTALSDATSYVSSTLSNCALATTGEIALGYTKGAYYCDVTGVAVGKANLTIAPASTTTNSPVVAFQVTKSVAASVALSTDKTSYNPGEKITLTITAKDADGNPLGSGSYDLLGAASTVSQSLTGTALTDAAFEYIDGVATTTYYAPLAAGPVTFSAKLSADAAVASAIQGTTVTTSPSVKDGNAAIMTQIDALNAKIVALNALIAKIMKKLGVR
jgi:hypothetical protein